MIRRFAGLMVGIALLLGAGAARAGANEVVLMLDPDRREVMTEALALELSGRGLSVLSLDAPRGDTSLARAAAAQEAARFIGAQVAVYVERAPDAQGGGTMVRAVGTDGDHLRRAPLPDGWEGVEPRIFAVVAHSLMDELVEVPEAGPVTVHVQVNVEAPGREVVASGGVNPAYAAAAPTVPAPTPAVPEAPPAPTAPATVIMVPGPVAPAPAAVAPPADGAEEEEEDPAILPRSGFFLEGGLMFAGIAAGGQVGLSFHLSEDFRLGIFGLGAGVLDAGSAFELGAMLTHVGNGSSGRFDYGVQLAALFVEDTGYGDATCVDFCDPMDSSFWLPGWSAGAFIGWAWELEAGLGLGIRLALNVAQVDGGDLVPAPYALGHVELPL